MKYINEKILPNKYAQNTVATIPILVCIINLAFKNDYLKHTYSFIITKFNEEHNKNNDRYNKIMLCSY